MSNMNLRVTSLASLLFLVSSSLLFQSSFHVTEALTLSYPPLVEGLSWDFYEFICPELEYIVRKQLKKEFKRDIGLAAVFMRLHFYDCFIEGCDASVLLDGSASGPSDQDLPPGMKLRPGAFKVIDKISRRVQKWCGNVVSCADITALTARDAVYLSGGPDYRVPLGRRDGFHFATRDETLDFLPPPTSNTSALIDAFAGVNLDVIDLVALSGAHTVGIAHCSSFRNRLYPTQDPTMDKTFANNLYWICPISDSTNTVALDVTSPDRFENMYFVDLMKRQGLLTSDQDLYTDLRTRGIVTSFAFKQELFF